MNLFNLDDKTRIKIQKIALGALAVTSTGLSALLIGASRHVDILEEQSERRLHLAKLNNRVVARYSELAPPEVTEKIIDEFQFDVVTLGEDLDLKWPDSQELQAL